LNKETVRVQDKCIRQMEWWDWNFWALRSQRGKRMKPFKKYVLMIVLKIINNKM